MADFFRQAALDVAATRYFTVAAITLLYAHTKSLVLTLGDEVELIWPAKVNPFSNHITSNRNLRPCCRTWILTNMYMELIAIQTTSFVVAARVFDIWEGSRTAFLVLGPLWTIHCVIDFVIVTQNAIRRAREWGLLMGGPWFG
ncbi:hypothetical protein AG1IA_04655 [Rhizoctonia solani AG-1 IA]|uniref:Uncharacterized protein n=1 Tax=Thanatephorus cucumeris (strain AG1-IA) TaxID=983506 RepID=L8WTM7_THACA|nr:hypothetical protein AG1IA_04655 [Rhizoctonia solani AG-1 IA]